MTGEEDPPSPASTAGPSAQPARPRGPLDELAVAAAGGDRAALEKLLRALGPVVLRVVRGVVGDRALNLEDVVQESLLALVRALPAFRCECGIVHYASRIAVRTAVSVRRALHNRQSLFPSAASDTEPTSEAGEASPYVGTVAERPDAHALSQKRREALRAVLATLPEAQSETLALRIVLGHSIEEIAETTGVPINTVRSRLGLAKRALREQIESNPAFAELLEAAQ